MIVEKPLYYIRGRFKRFGKKVYLQLSLSEQAYILNNWDQLCGWRQFTTIANYNSLDERYLIKVWGKKGLKNLRKIAQDMKDDIDKRLKEEYDQKKKIKGKPELISQPEK